MSDNFHGQFGFGSYTLMVGTSPDGNVLGSTSPLPSTIIGAGGDDTLSYSGTASATLYGLGGNDVLIANSGNDVLYGGAGNDQLWAGSGNSELWGGSGHDQFVFTLNEPMGAGTVIEDFHAGDHIKLVDQDGGLNGFAGVQYDQATGALAYDLQGHVIDLGHVAGHPALTAGDFIFN